MSLKLGRSYCDSNGSTSRHSLLPLASLIAVVGAVDATAETTSSVATFGVLQQAEKTIPRMERFEPEETLIQADMPDYSKSLSSTKVRLDKIELNDNSHIDENEVAKLVAPWLGKDVSLPEFEILLHRLSEFFKKTGHPDVQVSLVRDKVKKHLASVSVTGLNSRPVKHAEPPKVFVANIDVQGLTLLNDNELEALLRPWVNRNLSAQEITQLTDAISATLRNKGYALAQAYLPAQRVDDGTVTIQVVEGVVDGTVGNQGVVLTGATSRHQTALIDGFIQNGVTANAPLNIHQLESAVLLANDVPGVDLAVNLKPGEQVATTQVEVNIKDTKRWSADLWLDNYGSPLVAENRMTALFSLDSPSGRGERYSLELSHSVKMDSSKFSADFPLGHRGVRVGLSYGETEIEIGREFEILNLVSDSEVISGYLQIPINRSVERNSALYLAFTNKELRTDIGDIALNHREIDISTLSYQGHVPASPNSYLAWNASLSLGYLDLSKNPASLRADRMTANRAGDFAKFNFEVSQSQSFGAANQWRFTSKLNGQVANSNLDVYEKFQLGGPTGLRAYPIGEGLGDHGFLSTLELRRAILDTENGHFSLFGFYDAGWVRQHYKLWDQALPKDRDNQYWLLGAGVGASYKFDSLMSFDLVLANKIGNNPNPDANGSDVDGKRDNTRAWFIGSLSF